MIILFDYHINFLSDSDNKTKLPFTVFGMTQQGLSHQSYSIGNQDAACVYVGRNIIIGAVADGCTSGRNLNGMSSNQVGAHITSYLAVKVARKLVLKKHVNIEQLLNPFQQSLINNLKRTFNSLNPWKYEREEILKNFFSSTLIIFIITQDHYVVFSCGDGDAFINGVKNELTSSGGKYFSNNLHDLKFNSDVGYLINPDFQINCIQKGETNSLNNLLIATDGFIDRDVEDGDSFNDFFFNKEYYSTKRGFVDRKSEFRANFLEKITESKNGKLWPLDDATFISIQRNNEIIF